MNTSDLQPETDEQMCSSWALTFSTIPMKNIIWQPIQFAKFFPYPENCTVEVQFNHGGGECYTIMFWTPAFTLQYPPNHNASLTMQVQASYA